MFNWRLGAGMVLALVVAARYLRSARKTGEEKRVVERSLNEPTAKARLEEFQQKSKKQS